MLGDIVSVLQSELSSDERLLWSGRPKQGLLLRSADILLIPFSLMWGGFAIFWEVATASADAPPFFVMWGITFVLVGLFMIFGRFFVDAWQRSKTYYAVTNERILILSGTLGPNTRSLSLRSLSDMSLRLKRDGRGTITFGPSYPFWRSGLYPRMGRYAVAMFEMIEDAQAVYDLVRRTENSWPEARP
jgi:hypothetical protein